MKIQHALDGSNHLIMAYFVRSDLKINRSNCHIVLKEKLNRESLFYFGEPCRGRPTAR